MAPRAWPPRKGSGRPPRLTAAQRQQIPTFLTKGASAFGFRDDLWTRRRVATVWQREFGVKRSLQHVGTLRRQCGWTRQKPVRRAQRRDEAAIREWPKTTWQRLKKAQSEQRTIVLVDESGFYPLPAVAATWAPRGQTPNLTEWQTRDHLSVISGIMCDGHSTFQTHETAINGALVARFLKPLRHAIDERLPVIWDGSPIHRSQAVKTVLEQAAGRISVERLLGYAPDVNPDEGVWQHLKNVQLANVCSPDLATHRHELRNASAAPNAAKPTSSPPSAPTPDSRNFHADQQSGHLPMTPKVADSDEKSRIAMAYRIDAEWR